MINIESEGHIKEILKVAKIEVSDKDIKEQLTADNIIKTLKVYQIQL
ncbi:hypothetical protein OAR97_04600 [Arcobacteraceae bacterium]|nr:hypothetical protein [Arcobacteraceae bacterium]